MVATARNRAMKVKHAGRVMLIRCAGCGEHWPARDLVRALRLQAPGALNLCPTCWWDVRQACRSGGHDLGTLLELLAATAPI